jgi:predicted HD superfamily hydrolase involved in NAD metabolism
MAYTENKEQMALEYMNIEQIRSKLKKILPEHRYLHSLGAAEKAKELAELFDVDVKKATLAALLHDCARYMTKEETYKFIIEHEIPVAPEIMHSPSTLHAFAGEYIAQHVYGIKDPDILKAIKNHTLGDIEMTNLDKIVFIADKIEERTRTAKHFEEIRNQLIDTNDLDEAILISYGQTIVGLVEKGYYISPGTIRNWNYILQKTGRLPGYASQMDVLAQNNGKTTH